MICNENLQDAENTVKSSSSSTGNFGRLVTIVRFVYGKFFPYFHQFIITFPFFVLLIKNDILFENVISMSYLLPLLFSFVAMYAFNEIYDSSIDPPEKNLITSGRLLKKDALLLTILSFLVAIVSAIVIYESIIAIAVFFSYAFSSMAYSGLKIRFKTTLAGPFVASYILWVGPSLILLTEFSFWNPITISLLLGIFLVFSAQEIHHQISDYTGDKRMNAMTLTVRSGPRKAFLVSSILSIIGFIFIINAIYLNIQFLYFVLITLLISIFIFLQGVLAWTKSIIVRIDLWTKLVLISFACISFGFSLLLTSLVLFVFFSEVRHYVRLYKIPNK